MFVNNSSPDYYLFFYSIWRGTLQLISLTQPREQIARFTEMSFGANLQLYLGAGINVNQVTARPLSDTSHEHLYLISAKSHIG